MDTLQRTIRYTNEFWDHYGVNVAEEPEPGDLIFFSRDGKFPSHVGFVKDETSYIHAPGKIGTVVLLEAIPEEAIDTQAQSGRILYRTNPIGFRAPTQPYHERSDRYHQELA